jgi:hypothetical protein
MDVAQFPAVQHRAPHPIDCRLRLQGDRRSLEVERHRGGQHLEMAELLGGGVEQEVAELRVAPARPQAWNMYCIATRISPSTPPIACCSALANSGFGDPTRTGYCRRVSE